MSLPRLSPRNEGILTDAIGPMWRTMSPEAVVAELDRVMDFAASHDGQFNPNGYRSVARNAEPTCITCGRKHKRKKPK